MYISCQITVNFGRPIVPWSIIELHHEGSTFQKLFKEVKAGYFDVIPVSDELKRAKLLSTYVGVKKEALIKTSSSQCVISVCLQFGNFVKLCAELSEETQQDTMPLSNAFSVMIAAQRRLELGDNGLPFSLPEKDKKDLLYNDLIKLMIEMGIKWNDPESHGVSFLKNLRSVLWYIDGHHDTCHKKSGPPPKLFPRPVFGKAKTRPLLLKLAPDLNAWLQLPGIWVDLLVPVALAVAQDTLQNMKE